MPRAAERFGGSGRLCSCAIPSMCSCVLARKFKADSELLSQFVASLALLMCLVCGLFAILHVQVVNAESPVLIIIYNHALATKGEILTG